MLAKELTSKEDKDPDCGKYKESRDSYGCHEIDFESNLPPEEWAFCQLIKHFLFSYFISCDPIGVPAVSAVHIPRAEARYLAVAVALSFVELATVTARLEVHSYFSHVRLINY